MNAHTQLGPDLRQRFLDGMSRAAATVNVVATDGPAGRAGVTVSAMASVSADGDTPTLLVCIHHLSPAAATILENGRFVVNVLRQDQTAVSDTFAGRLKPGPGGDRFGCAEWVAMASGAPRVRDPLAAFDCRLLSAERIGTHHVLVGAVGEVFVAEAGNPLLFTNRAYGVAASLPPVRTVAEARRRTRLRIGALPPFGPYLLPRIAAAMEASHGPVAFDLVEAEQAPLLQRLREGSIDLAVLRDRGLGDGLEVARIAALEPHALLPAGHPLAARERIALPDLLSERLVLLDAGLGRAWTMALFDGIGTPQIGFRAQTLEMAAGLVGQGLGYTLLAARPAGAMSCDGHALAFRPLDGPAPSGSLVFANPAGVPRNMATDAFLRTAREILDLG